MQNTARVSCGVIKYTCKNCPERLPDFKKWAAEIANKLGETKYTQTIEIILTAPYFECDAVKVCQATGYSPDFVAPRMQRLLDNQILKDGQLCLSEMNSGNIDIEFSLIIL